MNNSTTPDHNRAAAAFTDVVAVEQIAPGMAEVTTWSDSYTVDARDGGCLCGDKQYRGVPMCKHEWAALAADVDRLPNPGIVTDDVRIRADGGPERPEECECTGESLPCFACFEAGFTTTAEGGA